MFLTTVIKIRHLDGAAVGHVKESSIRLQLTSNGRGNGTKQDVMKETRCFYENLCATRENKIVNLEIGNLINTLTLTEEESNSLEDLITKQEAHSALKQMKNDKSPGSDGYTTEFFTSFFVDLGSRTLY